MYDNKSLVDLVRSELVHYGLGGTDIIKDPSGSEAFMVRDNDGYKAKMDVYFPLSFDISKMRISPKHYAEEVDRALKPMHDSFKSSPYVAELLNKIAMYEKEVESLRPYKTYYMMEYTLRQGKEK
jgi:hypothetical protein